MKQTLTLICIVCPFFLFAQTANHFENESSRWFVAESYGNGNPQNPSFIETVTTVYGFQGDTIIGGETWLKMYSTPDSSFSANLEYEGLINSSDGFVVFQDTASTTDTIYNFNLTLGDSFLFDFGFETEYIDIIEVDSVEINGEMYKRLSFDEPEGPNAFTNFYEIWIEGIGSWHGPLFPHKPRVFSTEFPESLYLTCSHENDILYWESEFHDACVVNIILDIENAETVGFDIYPNPSSSQIFIRQQQVNAGQFYVRDILGKEVRSGLLQSDNQSVDISELKRGVYFLTVLFDNTTLTKEILKY
jgi:hypothetical protein